MEPIRPTLVIVPASPRTPQELDALVACLVSAWSTVPADAHLCVVAGEDARPEHVELLSVATAELGASLLTEGTGRSFVAGANAGLAHALAEGADAVLVDPAVELFQPDWLERMRSREDTQGRPAAVVGARLVTGEGLLRHAGLYFSLLRRQWFRRFEFGPAALPAALKPCLCPVAASLCLVRHETLAAVGLLDDALTPDDAAVDYCLRAFTAGLEAIYDPAVVGRLGAQDQREANPSEGRVLRSLARLTDKHARLDLSLWTPEPL